MSGTDMRGKKQRGAQVLLLVCAAASAGALFLVHASSVSAAGEDTVLSGQSLDGQSLDGMTDSQVESLADSIVSSRKSAQITLTGPSDGESVTVSAGDLGLSWSNPEIIDEIEDCGHGANIIQRYKEQKDLEENGASYTIGTDFDLNTITDTIQNDCAAAWDREGTGGKITRVNGVLQVSDGTTGQQVDVAKSAESLYQALTNGWDGNDLSVAMTVSETQADVDTDVLAKMTDTLGTFTTYYTNSGAARCTNIDNGCRLISGTFLKPGESFSVLNALTPFTEENGYQLAGSYLNNEVVESLGGGICQVSTTLYNAVIRAELNVTQRSNHSLLVSYVQPSEDAAIAESAGMDMCFTNNLQYPVYIEGYTYNKSITFNIIGVETRDAGRQVSFESETTEEIPSEGTKVKTDATQPVGYVSTADGHTGVKAQLWKIVTENGVEVSREVFNHSEYAMTPMTITVGTAGTMTQELQDAIDAGDLETIKAAAADAAAGVDNAQDASSADSSSDTASDPLTQAAQDAAQDAYADALAQGKDTNTAMAEAQTAAEAVVQQAAGGASSASSDAFSAAASSSDTGTAQ